jgi:hypothetical protein
VFLHTRTQFMELFIIAITLFLLDTLMIVHGKKNASVALMPASFHW